MLCVKSEYACTPCLYIIWYSNQAAPAAAGFLALYFQSFYKHHISFNKAVGTGQASPFFFANVNIGFLD